MRRIRVGYTYDEKLDRAMQQDNARMAAIMKKLPKYKRQLASIKAAQTKKKKPGARNIDAEQSAREVAEQGAAETVRMAVRALEQALLTLQDVPAPNQYRRSINPHAVHNAIFALKQKSGVYFPPEELEDQFSNREVLDRVKAPYVPLWERNKET